MRKIFLFALILSACATQRKLQRPAAEPSIPHVLVISIDALRPEFYLSDQFHTPILKSLVQKGAYASGVRPVFPTVTYPNHTALMTGVRAAKSGIYANRLFSFDPEAKTPWYWEARYIQVPTLWQAARSAALSTSALGWPVTAGADINWLVPEIFLPDTINSPEVWQLHVKTVDPALMKEIQTDASISSFVDFFQHDRWMTDAAISIEHRHHPHLLAVHLSNVDHIQHETGRDSAETKAAVAEVDRLIGKILDGIDLKSTAVFIVGDHGFRNYRTELNFNALFAAAGWAGRVVAQNSGAAAIYLRDPSLGPAVLKRLRAVAPGKFDIISRAELDKLEAFPGAFCAVNPRDGMDAGSQTKGPFVHRISGVRGDHGFLPSDPKLNTGLIALLPQPRQKHENLGVIEIIDIAPTIAGILHLFLPQAEGHDLKL